MKTEAFAHQKIGTAALVKNKSFALFDEPGAGKSKQVIDAACTLAERGEIDTVVVVAPASVRCVWLDAEIGEIKKHSWSPLNAVVEFHGQTKVVWANTTIEGTRRRGLLWICTNYEFLRGEKHLLSLNMKLLDRKTMLVLDESSYVKSRTAQQSKAAAKLREHCTRCVLLNGTPVTNSPLDLWSQMQILDKRILGKAFKDNFYYFRSEHCEMVNQKFGGHSFKKIVGYKRLDRLAKRVAPYVLRRLKADCLDLPPKLYTEREVALTKESWMRYKELKRDCLLTLDSGEKQLEPNAAVRIMRLAQLTSGILGGPEIDNSLNDMIKTTRDLSDEKLKWCVQYLIEECTAKAVIVWTRWRRERERLVEALQDFSEDIVVRQIYGGQSKRERELAVSDFSKPSNSGFKFVCVAQQHAGGYGLNLVAASEAIYLSNDFSLGIRLQSEDRCHRPGQVNPVLYTDILAVGPDGQKTIDHVIFKALREKQNIAEFTTARWRRELAENN